MVHGFVVRLLCLLSLALAGCGTLRPHRHDVLPARGPERWKRAAVEAFLSPETILPLAAAGIVAAAGSDERISAWAVERTPVFGSKENASRWSDNLVAASYGLSLSSILLVPDGDDETLSSFGTKGRFLLWGAAARSVNGATTHVLKVTTQRPRPGGGDLRSFPSGHSSDAAANAVIFARNVEYLPLTPAARWTVRAGAVTLAAGTAWARVEGEKHYPTDVLAGAALGAFFGNFFYNAFLPDNPRFTVSPLDETMQLSLRFAW